MIGIVIGVITAVIISNLYVHVICESKVLSKPKLVGVSDSGTDQHTQFNKRFSFIKHRKIFYICSIAILVIGFGVGGVRAVTGGSFFNEGIDFSGGTMIQIDMEKNVETSDIEKTLKDLDVSDASVVHYDAKSGADKGIVIRTTQSMSTDAREAFVSDFTSKYDLEPSAVQSFENFGPSIGNLLKKNAVTSILIAALCMLLYIIVRFRWRFGVAALAGILHDVLVMIALYSMFHMTVNNPFIATILTIVGYSINDTIVIFDRVRENLTGMSRKPLDELIDISVNQTLVRSVLTSLTTLLAILPLVFLGGSTIREFAIPLMIGIIAGAASSIFVCSPLFYDLNRIGGKNRRGKYSASIGGGNAPKNDYAAKTGAAGAKGHKKKSKSQRKPGDGAVV
jgi:SecD/SecF fusion protein